MTKFGEAYIGSKEQRLFDVSGAIAIGAVSWPAVAAAALALKWETGSTAFLKQQRIGKNGEPFKILKIRTLVEQDLSGIQELGGSDHPLAGRIGRIVRKLGIDEFPQIVNVLRSDLHLVGVRTQIEITREQRRDADPYLYEDWDYWARQNPGALSPGAVLAHMHNGAYSENSDLIRDVMKLEIGHCETASLGRDMDFLISCPIKLIGAALRSGLRRSETSAD